MSASREITALKKRLSALTASNAKLRETLEYMLGSNSQCHPMFGGTPTIGDLCYTLFNFVKANKNAEDGGPVDWFNDTKPIVDQAIAKWRSALADAQGAEKEGHRD